jgi:hypothetical protein
MASQLELTEDFLQVRRTQLTGSTRRLAARGQPDQLFAGGFVLVAFNHRLYLLLEKNHLSSTNDAITSPYPLNWNKGRGLGCATSANDLRPRMPKRLFPVLMTDWLRGTDFQPVILPVPQEAQKSQAGSPCYAAIENNPCATRSIKGGDIR